MFTEPGAADSHASPKWSVNFQLLWKILVYAHASKSADHSNDIFGPILGKDSLGSSGMNSAGVIAEPDFALIGSAGLSGHKTVASECVTYPPEQTDNVMQDQDTLSQNAAAMDLPGLSGDPTLDLNCGDTLYLQLQDYGRAFEDWLSVNPG